MESIKIYARVRPMTYLECETGLRSCNEIDSLNNLYYLRKSNKDNPKCFSFSKIFDEKSRQSDIYEHIAKPMVADFLQGYNCTIMAYGSIGNGKTHTIEGSMEPAIERGLAPRIIEALLKSGLSSSMKMAFFEVFDRHTRSLIQIDSLAGEEVRSFLLLETYYKGIALKSINLDKNSHGSCVILKISYGDATFTIVDLYGTTRQLELQMLDQKFSSGSGPSIGAGSDQRLSLMALGNVINALVTNQPHIPFRDCLLTSILRPSLLESKIAAIMCLSPSQESHLGNLSACTFALRAKQIKSHVFQNIDPRKDEIMALRARIGELTQEIAEKKKLIKKEVNEETVTQKEKKPMDQEKQAYIARFKEISTSIDAEIEKQKSLIRKTSKYIEKTKSLVELKEKIELERMPAKEYLLEIEKKKSIVQETNDSTDQLKNKMDYLHFLRDLANDISTDSSSLAEIN